MSLKHRVLERLNKNPNFKEQKEINNREVKALIEVLNEVCIDILTNLPEHTPYEGTQKN